MSKPYHKLEDAAIRAYVLLQNIANGNHKSLELAESGAAQLKDALELCENNDIARIAQEVGGTNE